VCLPLARPSMGKRAEPVAKVVGATLSKGCLVFVICRCRLFCVGDISVDKVAAATVVNPASHLDIRLHHFGCFK